MLVRKCDICKKEIKNFWEFKADYITFGERVKNTGKAIRLEICEDCMDKIDILKEEGYAYVTSI